MSRSGRHEQKRQLKVLEFVPSEELNRAEQRLEKQRREMERLQQEVERLRKELETALRASERQAAPHSRGAPKHHPPSGRDANRAGAMADKHAAPSPRLWMNG